MLPETATAAPAEDQSIEYRPSSPIGFSMLSPLTSPVSIHEDNGFLDFFSAESPRLLHSHKPSLSSGQTIDLTVADFDQNKGDFSQPVDLGTFNWNTIEGNIKESEILNPNIQDKFMKDLYNGMLT